MKRMKMLKRSIKSSPCLSPLNLKADEDSEGTEVIAKEDANLASALDKQKNDSKLDVKQKEQAEENKKSLVPIVKTIIFVGKNGLPLRGHRDDGPLDYEKALSGSEGNFRGLLAFRIDSGDTSLQHHLDNAKRNATDISKETQNTLINLCGEEILKHIVTEIHQAKYYSIIADETSDTSHKEQLCLCIRYVNQACILKEEFVSFCTLEDLSAKSISEEILSMLGKMNLDIKYCVGQGYDGASTMSGHISGVQQLIRDEAPLAVYVHCASHCLNSVLNRTSSVLPIQNMFCKVSEVIRFINESPKRRNIFDKTFLPYCETRFVQRHDALLRFGDNFATIMDGLQEISESVLFETKTKLLALSLLNSMANSSFCVSLAAARKVMSLTAALSRQLQSPFLNFSEGMRLVKDVTDQLQIWRLSNTVWNDEEYNVYHEATKFGVIAGIDLVKPRSASRQQHKASCMDQEELNVTDYFKRTIWYPYIDAVNAEISAKFNQSIPAFSLAKSFFSMENAVYKQIFDTYGAILNCGELELYEEIKQFSRYSESNRSESLLDVLEKIPKTFVHVRQLLQIAITLPLTTCSAERSFSAMKILKSRLGSNMVEDRLNGLALMYIHKTINLVPETIIDNFFCNQKP